MERKLKTTPAAKRARDNYVKRHPDRVRYQHYKSTAKLFVKSATQPDLRDLQELIKQYLK